MPSSLAEVPPTGEPAPHGGLVFRAPKWYPLRPEENVNRQLTQVIAFLACYFVFPAWADGPVFLPEAELEEQLHKRAPLPDASVRYFYQLLGRNRFERQAALVDGRQLDTVPELLDAPEPPILQLSVRSDAGGLVRPGQTTGIADIDMLVETSMRMAEQAALHFTLTQVHSGEVPMQTTDLLEHWKTSQQSKTPDPFFVEQNRSALLSLLVERYRTFSLTQFRAHAGAHRNERGWFWDAIQSIKLQDGLWPQIWNAAPGELSDLKSPRASVRRAFLKSQFETIEQMASDYLDAYLAEPAQSFESVFPLLDKELRTEPHQQKLLTWLIPRAETPRQLGSLFGTELWDAAFLRFAGDIKDDKVDPMDRPIRTDCEGSFPEELLFGQVFLQLLERAESGMGISPTEFLADVFARLLGSSPPSSLNFMLETYLFHIEKLLEKGVLPSASYEAMEVHLKAIARELFSRAPEPLTDETSWHRSVAEYALKLLQEVIVLSRGWHPPTQASIAEIFDLSTSPDTDPFLAIAARSALINFIPQMLETSIRTLQGPRPESPEAAAFVEKMRSCVGLIAQAADQAGNLNPKN